MKLDKSTLKKKIPSAAKLCSTNWQQTLILLTTLFCSTVVFSLESDQKKPLLLSANSAEFSNKTHKGIYIGKVQLDQGTTHLKAHEATTYANEKNQLTLAIAKGLKETQAHYWTITDEKKPPLHAFANTIKYYPGKHLIELIGNAKVTQGDDSYQAPIITYDTLNQHVVSKANKYGRTTIIVHPNTTATS